MSVDMEDGVSARVLSTLVRPGLEERLVVPGSVVSDVEGFMRGHGTFQRGTDLIASLAGTVHQVNRLVSVRSIKARYGGEVGDVVIGRVIDVQQKQWKVNINSRLDSRLQLSSVNLPGGELRRKSLEDELMMREYLKEGDLISAEVQQIPPYLIKRRKTHFHSLPCGAATVFGCNGFVWICPALSEDPDGGYNQDLTEVITMDTRVVMGRLAACVRLLAAHCVSVFDSSLMNAYNLSLPFKVSELSGRKVAEEIALEVVNTLQNEMEMA